MRLSESNGQQERHCATLISAKRALRRRALYALATEYRRRSSDANDGVRTRRGERGLALLLTPPTLISRVNEKRIDTGGAGLDPGEDEAVRRLSLRGEGAPARRLPRRQPDRGPPGGLVWLATGQFGGAGVEARRSRRRFGPPGSVGRNDVLRLEHLADCNGVQRVTDPA